MDVIRSYDDPSLNRIGIVTMVSEPKPDLPPLPSPNSTSTPPSLPHAPAATPSYPMLNPSSPLPKMPPTSLTPPHSTSMATVSSKSAVPATAAAATTAPSPFCGSSLTVRRNPPEKQEVNSSNFKPISSSSNCSPGIRPNVSSIPSPQVGPEPVLEYYCNLCLDNCSYKRYHCNTLRDYDLCLSCFACEGLELGLTPLDFSYREDEERKLDVLEYWCNRCFTKCTDEHYRCNKFFSYHLCLTCFTNEEFEFGLNPRDFIHVKAVEGDSIPAIEASRPHHYPSDNSAPVEDGISAGSSIHPLLVNPTAKNTEKISRDHIVCDFPGLVSVTSGKWTTYRSMAEDAAIRSAKLKPANSCVTKNLSMVGGDLQTLGRLDYVKRLSHSVSVHQKVDLFNDEVLTFGYSHSALYVICRVIFKGGVMNDPSNKTGPNFDLEFRDDVHEEAMLATAHAFGGHFPSQDNRLMFLFEVEKDIEGVEASVHESLMAVTFATLSEKKENGSSLLLRPEENALRMRMGAERICMPAPSVEQFVDVVNATVLADKRWVPPTQEGSMFKHWVPILVGVRRQLDLEMIESSVFEGSADFSYTSESKFQLYRILEGLLQHYIPLQWTEPARAELLGWFLDALGTITSDWEGADVFTKIEGQPGVKFEHIYASQPVYVAKSAGSQAAEVIANASDNMILVFRTQVEQPLSSLGSPPVHLIVEALAKASRYTDIKRRSLLSYMENSQGQMLSLNNLAEMFKLIGNWLIQSESYIEAINLYTCAIARCEKIAVYYCNKAAAFIHMQRYTEAIHNCVKAIEVGPNKKRLLDALNENLKHSNAQIQCAVLEALKHFGDKIASNVTLRYLKFFDDSNVATSLPDQDGGNFSAWSWCKTISLLEDKGFRVTAIDFAGSGPDCFDTNDITSLAQCVKPLTSFLEKLGDEEKVILGEHDFGGAYISFAMEVFYQIDPARYKSISSEFGVLLKEHGVRGLFRGWVPTLLDYSAQGARKFGFYEFFKKYYSDIVGPEYAAKYKTRICLAGSASAKVIADVALCPMEAMQVRIQNQPGFSTGLSNGLPKFVNAKGDLRLCKEIVLPWGSQIPYTRMKFASFETIVEMFCKYAIPIPKDQCSKSFQLGVSFVYGYVAGVLCAIISHPADNLVSSLNNAKGPLEYIGSYQVSFGPISWLTISLSGDEDRFIDLEDKVNLRGKD